MSAYIRGSKSNLRSNSPLMNGGRSPSPARGTKSEAGYSTHSQKSTGSKVKSYPRKGSTLGNMDLSPEEMEHLESVLQRFDQFRVTEEKRVRSLKDQLVEKQKARIRNAEASGDGHCYNCGRLFMPVFNPPVKCYLCKHEFCRMCLEKMPKSKELICKFCRFESVRRGQLGVWFTEELKMARAQGRVRGVSGPEALRSSLIRIKKESRANSLIQNAQDLSPNQPFASLSEMTESKTDLRDSSYPLDSSLKLQSPEDCSPLRDSILDLAIPLVNVRENKEDMDAVYKRNLEQMEQQERISFRQSVSIAFLSPHEELCVDKLEQNIPLVSTENSPSPLKTSTIEASRNKMSFGEFEMLTGEPMIDRLDATGLGTPISSVEKTQKSYESELRTPDDTELLSDPPVMGMLQGDSTGPEAEAHLAARSRFRRVRYMDVRGSMESFPGGSDSGYGPPRTETWVQQAQNEHDQSSTVSGQTGNQQSPGSLKPTKAGPGSDSSYGRTPSGISERPPGSSASGISRPATPSQPRRDLRSSFSDLRGHGHHARLTSDAGSKSTLSLTSKGTGSMLSLYSERESSYTHGIAITGDLRLDIRYDAQSSTLRIAVKQARDLAIADKKSQACNPYVKSYLLPDKTKGSKRKTSYKKHTRNPVFDEELKYHIPYSDLSERSLQISVWHKASVGSNLFLGEVIIPFTDFSFESGANWYPLAERRQIALSPSLQIFRGELLMALKLVPGGTMGRQSELHVWIKSAKGLSTSTSGKSKSSSVDPYCKIYLMPDKAKNSKRKTSVVKKNNNPEWNTNFVYQNIDRTQLNTMGLEVSIWDHDRFSSNDFLGGCRINNGTFAQPWMDAVGTEQSVWVAMLERPQTWFEGLIRLRSNLD
ncbi:Synaptotagmin 4 [Fasciola gigantica]|uniref:Synaptotagmin 4 n=1 Tax=Fasciola gigantica TaxID=46835 RepID=A0A504YFC2_FASGI|nr:Synaptotagmin 4 [Fasciola gigantica]